MFKLQKEKILNALTFEKILILYIILQPIIDIITSLCVRNLSENLTLGIFIRAIFMVYIIIYTIIKTEKKDRLKIILYFCCFGLYLAIFLINSYLKFGFAMIFTQFKGLIKAFYFPIVLSGLLIIVKNKNYTSKNKYLNIALYLYVLTIIFCKLVNFGYETYPHNNKVGTIGLFYAGNEISSIISLLAPIGFVHFLDKKFDLGNALMCTLIILVMLEIGTKVAFISAICILLLTLITSLVKLFNKNGDKNLKHFIVILSICIFVFLSISSTSAGKNQKIKSVFSIKPSVAEAVEEDIESDEKEEKTTSTSNPSNLLSGRTKYYKRTLSSYKDGSIIDKIFGLGYVSQDEEDLYESKLIEIDYFDIFFCHGIVGTIIYIIPLVIIVFNLIKKFFINFIVNIKNYKIFFVIYSVLIGFGIALTAGHVFNAPAVSMFLILNIIELYIILNKKEDLKDE